VKGSRRAFRIAASALACLVACGGPPSQPWRPQTESAARWATTLDAWTRRGASYQAFEGRLFITATCTAPAASAALLRERAAREGWSGDRLEQALAEQTTRDAESLVFLVGVTAQDARWDDTAPGGTLEMHVRLDGTPVSVRRITRLGEDAIGDLVPYFSWISPLHSVYRLEVDPRGEPTRVDLTVAGPPAKVELTWEMPR
jgi:hypothetical protein